MKGEQKEADGKPAGGDESKGETQEGAKITGGSQAG